jgi:hypothetical protein
MARREDRTGSAKIAVFAYYRDSRQPYWQSGVARSDSDSKAAWILGIGPFQRGSIRGGTQFAGSRFGKSIPQLQDHENLENFLSSRIFDQQTQETVRTVGHQQNTDDSHSTQTATNTVKAK